LTFVHRSDCAPDITSATSQTPSRAICRSGGPVRFYSHEWLLEGSQGEGAGCGGPGDSEAAGGRALRPLALVPQALTEAPPRRQGPRAQALAGAHPAHPGHHRPEAGLVGPARSQRRCHTRAPLRAVGGAPRREGVGGDHEPGGAQARLDLQEKSLAATERDEEQRRSAWRECLKGIDSRRLVFVDESSTNVALTPRYARAPRGERARGKAPRNWGKNVTLISSISLEGVGPSMSIEGS
jgi:hypothetical protein